MTENPSIQSIEKMACRNLPFGLKAESYSFPAHSPLTPLYVSDQASRIVSMYLGFLKTWPSETQAVRLQKKGNEILYDTLPDP
jgi:hypothetical protein